MNVEFGRADQGKIIPKNKISFPGEMKAAALEPGKRVQAVLQILMLHQVHFDITDT